MLSLFKKNKNVEEKDASVEAENFVEREATRQETPGDEQEVETYLDFHPDWDVSNQERYVYGFHHAQLPKLKPNQVSISGIDIVQDNEFFIVNAFIRNTVEKPIRFEEVVLLLLDREGKIAARKTFDLEILGEIPPNACRPWTFLFSEEDVVAESFPIDNWTLAFELRQKEPSGHSLMLDEAWENNLNDVQKTRLRELVNNLPPLASGEINFMGIEARMSDTDELHVTLLIRNGSEKDIHIEQIPLFVEDASGQVVAKGGFQLNHFEVKANTSKPWTFIFPESLLETKEIDLSRWRVFLPEHQQA
ncbi:accessory Sec system S-layer assembly protein [Fictibacillus gelatini]|uniref:accessory Sec system S-layer assembly protein n=1 Tax=Fictibacillus gelatini TaxID=225985 RepID=UPI0003FE9D7E|nr:accessory Sec system S-layer assembly protein [Fictibacillus gelatini]